MAADNPRGAMFRVLMPDQHSRVTNAELFFDLVFVFAVTQLSHTLLHHFTPLGAVQVTLLFLAVWWVWVYTAWVTNWLDPEQTPVRHSAVPLMLGGLVLSMSIPKAFEERGLWFAGAYAAMQVGRTAFWLLATPPPAHAGAPQRDPHPGLALVSAVFWIAGGLAEGETRLDALGRRAGDRICLRRRCASGRRGSGFSRSKPGRSKAAIWPSAAPASSSSRSAKPSSSQGATFAELTWTPENVAAFLSALGRQHRDVVDLFPQGRRGRLRKAVQIRRIRAGWRGSPTPICTCRSSAASSLPPLRTSSC